MRSTWKGIFINKKIFSTSQNIKSSYNKADGVSGYFKNINNISILSVFVGLVFYLYNGKRFESIMVKENMVGFKLGNFIHTKKTPVYFNKKKKKRKK